MIFYPEYPSKNLFAQTYHQIYRKSLKQDLKFINMSNLKSKIPFSKSSTYLNLNSFNYSSEPVESLDLILQQQWQIMSLEISSHGNNGVLFIQTTIGSFVLKMNNEGPADLFFNTFAELLDVNVPQIKIVACYEDFFQFLTFKIQQFCQKDQQLSTRLRKRMDFPFYQIMQYIPSISFLQIGRDRFKKNQLSESKLQSIGICIGFDLVINNSDRFKLSKIWSTSNEGNVANVLIKVPDHFLYPREKIKDRQENTISLGEYFFIDHSGFLLDIQRNKLAADNFSKYVEKVSIFHDQLIQFMRKELPCPQPFDGLIKQIQFYTKYRMEEDQLSSVVEGIIYSTSMFIDYFQQQAFVNIIKDLYREAMEQSHREEVKYWDEYWNLDLAKIKLKHLEVYHLKVSAIYATYSQVINTICEKVAKNITETKKNYGKKKEFSARKNNRSQSNRSNLSNKTKNQQDKNINLDFLQNIKDDMDEVGIDKDDQNKYDLASNRLKQEESKQDLAKKRLKERLEAFQRKNYQQQNSKNNN